MTTPVRISNLALSASRTFTTGVRGTATDFGRKLATVNSNTLTRSPRESRLPPKVPKDETYRSNATRTNRSPSVRTQLRNMMPRGANPEYSKDPQTQAFCEDLVAREGPDGMVAWMLQLLHRDCDRKLAEEESSAFGKSACLAGARQVSSPKDDESNHSVVEESSTLGEGACLAMMREEMKSPTETVVAEEMRRQAVFALDRTQSDTSSSSEETQVDVAALRRKAEEIRARREREAKRRSAEIDAERKAWGENVFGPAIDASMERIHQQNRPRKTTPKRSSRHYIVIKREGQPDSRRYPVDAVDKARRPLTGGVGDSTALKRHLQPRHVALIAEEAAEEGFRVDSVDSAVRYIRGGAVQRVPAFERRRTLNPYMVAAIAGEAAEQGILVDSVDSAWRYLRGGVQASPVSRREIKPAFERRPTLNPNMVAAIAGEAAEQGILVDSVDSARRYLRGGVQASPVFRREIKPEVRDCLDDATFLTHQDWEQRLEASQLRRKEQQQSVQSEEEHSTGIFDTVKTWATGLWKKIKTTLWG